MERVVAPVDQMYPPIVVAEEARVIPVPGQRLVDPLAVMVGGAGVAVTATFVVLDVALQAPEVTVTLWLPVDDTVIDCVVAPFDQWLPVELLLLRTTLPPGQNESGPLALMVGVGIEEFTVTDTAADVADVPDLVTFTV